MSKPHNAEEQFYSGYAWCLNPILSIEELFDHLKDEVHSSAGLVEWQREESIINIYLFVCAIACTLDDYVARRLLNLAPIRTHLPKLQFVISVAERVVRIIEWFRGLADYRIQRFRRAWSECVELACNMLIDDSTRRNAHIEKFHVVLESSLRHKLPQRVLTQRMRLPEAFRRQDFTHQDVISLARRFADSVSSTDRPTVLVGLRTAGAYFAPLITAYLKRNGWSQVLWFTIRPKKGLSIRERRLLAPHRTRNGRVVVVDDYPATGKTLRLTLKALSECRVAPEQITVVAPTHAAQPNWVEASGICEQIPVFTLQPWELHKAALMHPEAVRSLCAEYYRSEGWTRVRILDDEHTATLNRRLADHLRDAHHVREKRVFRIELSAEGREPEVKKIFLKSAGWGWLGYHAYLAGKRLEGFVPRLIGFRNGIMITEWIDDAASVMEPALGIDTVRRVGSYIAARTRRLRLSSYSQTKGVTYSAVGVDEIVNLLRAGYGPYINRLKRPTLRKHLYESIGMTPTLLDGQMKPDEWLRRPAAIYKADFEHHNFGGAELDLVDPGYDLAAAMLEFRLSRELERELLQTYTCESGDSIPAERILIYKILYGSLAMSHALDRVVNGRDPEKNNERYLYARNWLIYSMNDFCSMTVGSGTTHWTDLLFFMDLDGVFDQPVLGFPHSTHKGLRSLALLQETGRSIVPNTGRSIENVRNYCQTYGFPGGVAEFGSVFIDHVSKRELPLINDEGANQLARCKDALKGITGIFLDPAYQYSIRAYRFNGRRTAGLSDREIQTVLEDPRFDQLSCISRAADTHIVQRNINKGTAVKFVRKYLGCATTPAAAIGDSIQDVPMLTAVEHAYAPANCNPVVRELARKNRCRVMGRRFQSGLLKAVEHHVGERSVEGAKEGLNPRSIMRTFLQAADRPFALQLVAALFWWNL